jgi:hypothetical protein
MKKYLICAAALLLGASVVYAAQDSALTIRQVRDPVQLKDKLNANALDTETRVAALEVTIGTNVTDAVVSGTLGVTGVATFTAESVHNGGIDADYVTVDAAAGVDTKTAGALVIGAATATSVAVGASDCGVSIPGTLAVTGVATFTAAPTLVTTNNAGAITLTMTNAPTAADAGKAAPAYIRITIGTTSYVIPAWPLTP